MQPIIDPVDPRINNVNWDLVPCANMELLIADGQATLRADTNVSWQRVGVCVTGGIAAYNIGNLLAALATGTNTQVTSIIAIVGVILVLCAWCQWDATTVEHKLRVRTYDLLFDLLTERYPVTANKEETK